MSEAARARERLEFESVAETINKGKQGKGSVPPIELLSSTLATAGLQFTPGAAEVRRLSNFWNIHVCCFTLLSNVGVGMVWYGTVFETSVR